ncbi:isoprenoid synthase domain-containing protein [Mycena latifolia]|nr:isoprenoid synthase domain-containing protein [Mycena latifolia]KAJ7458511.1 isoprenoid synthase domain-containing protein [Mycena latifolia]
MPIYDDLHATLSDPSPWSAGSESKVLAPFTYLTENPGKNVLDRFIAAFDIWMTVPDDAHKIISKVANMLHNASLMVDDIQDDSQLRRGKPVAHSVYGIPQTINSANYVYFLAYQEALGLQHARQSDKELISMVTAELMSLHRGQGLELIWRDSLYCPTEEEYVHMVNNKTSGLLRIAIRLMMACATTNIDVDYVPLMNLIGLFYQIRDDLMNLQSPVYSSTKGFAEDLSEGKFSFPIIHAMRADPENHEILDVLQKRPATPTLKIRTIEYLREHTKSFEYTVSVLDKIEAQVRAEVARLGGNAALEKIVDALHVDRASLS